MHGAWCWYKIVDLLEKDGHKVSAIDLMSVDTNLAAAYSINSFEEYNQPLMHFLAKLPQTEKIVLVGHSMGGVSLARESEDFPHLIAVAVWSRTNKIEYNFGNGIGEPPTSVLVPKKKFKKDYLYGTTSTLDVTLASLLLRPLPNMVMMNMSVETTEERYGVVPRVYVKTTKDNVLCLAKQEELIASSPPEKVYSLDSDHSPFFSEPEKLHNLLLEIVDTYCN